MYNTNQEKNRPEEILLLNKDSMIASGLLFPETEQVQFTFEGDGSFTKERIGQMKSLVNRQIDTVLSREVLYTKDVFVPELHLEKQKRAEEAHNRLELSTRWDNF